MGETFFVDLDADRNQRRYQALLDEQYRIAYVSQGGMTFHEVGCLTTEDRKAVVEIITNIKREEKEAMDKATAASRTATPPPRSFPKTHKYSSLTNKFKTPFRAPTGRR